MSDRVIQKSRNEYMLEIETVTWFSKVYSLFDYDFKKDSLMQLFEFSLYGLDNKILMKECNKFQCPIQFIKLQLLMCLQIKFVCKRILLLFHPITEFITQQESKQNLYNNQPIQDIYVVVRSLKNIQGQSLGYKIQPGQLIKLGKAKFFINSVGNNSSQSCLNNVIGNTIYQVDNSNIDDTSECKYCMVEDNPQIEGQFLCSPCKCSGSCGLVHFNCLEKWNQSKVKANKVNGTIQYNFQQFFCEMCKQIYPKFIKKNKKIYELMAMDKPKGHHLIMQGSGTTNKNIIVIENITNKGGIRIGNGSECEIYINDATVCRFHSKIQQIQLDYYIYDYQSKFGTLVNSENLILEINCISKAVQIGRTIFKIKLVKNKLNKIIN